MSNTVIITGTLEHVSKAAQWAESNGMDFELKNTAPDQVADDNTFTFDFDDANDAATFKLFWF